MFDAKMMNKVRKVRKENNDFRDRPSCRNSLERYECECVNESMLRTLNV